MTTVYVTTANYALDVAITANNVATSANNLVNTLYNLNINVTDAFSNAALAQANAATAQSNAALAQSNAALAQANALTAQSNAANAFFLSFTANNIANYANNTANIANIVANYANNTANIANIVANYANNTANIANIVATYAYSNAQTANIIANNIQLILNQGLVDTVTYANIVATYANNTANIANIVATYANNTANIANIVATYAYSNGYNANIIATYAYSNAQTANIIATYALSNAQSANNILTSIQLSLNQGLVEKVSNAFSNAALAQSNAALAQANATTAQANAYNANNLAYTANAVAYYANIMAYATNNFVTSINLYATATAATYDAILNSGYSFWSNNAGNTYINKNVGIGTSSVSNALDIIGNVYISGNIFVGGIGGGAFKSLTTSPSGLFRFTNDYNQPTPYGPRGEIIMPFSTMTGYGVTQLTTNSNGLLFSQVGVYTVTLCIQGTNADGNYDTMGSVNVYTNTTRFMTGATRIYSDASSITFGPIKQNLIIPLNVTNTSNTYSFGVNFFRNNSTTTIKSGDFNASYIQISPLIGGAIPINTLAVTDSAISQITDPAGNKKVGILNTNPLFPLDVGGVINSTDIYLNGSPFITNTTDGYNLLPNVSFTRNITVGQNVYANYILGNAYYTSGSVFNRGVGNSWTFSNIGIGISTVSNALDVRGQVFVNGNVTAKYFFGDITKALGYYYPFSQWLLGTGNAWTLSNIGIGTSSVSNTLTVNGNVSANYLFANIFYASGFINSPLTTGTGNAWTLSNIGIGTSSVSNTLTVNGNVSANNYYGNIYYTSGAVFTRGTAGNAFTLSNISIGSSSGSNTLSVNGNVYVSGTLKAESMFMVACSDQSTPIVIRQSITSFRSPGNWVLTMVPRISLVNPSATGFVNVNIRIDQSTTPLLSSNIYIPSGQYSSKSAPTQPTFNTNMISDDAIVNIDTNNVGDGNPTGLKIVFYYMNV